MRKIVAIAFGCLLIQAFFAQSLNDQWLNLINQGKEKYKINSYKTALEYFQKAAKLIPTDTTAYVYIMDCAYKLQLASLVDESLDNLMFIGYERPGFYELAIASARDIEEDYTKAFRFAGEAKVKFPNHPGILFEEAKIFYKQKNYDQAVGKLIELIELTKTNQTYHQLLIHLYINDLNNLQKALEAVFRAQNYIPDNIEYKIQEADI